MNQVDSLKRRNLVFGIVAGLLLVFLVFRPSDTSAVGTDAYPTLFKDLNVEDVRAFSLKRVAASGKDAPEEEIRIARGGEISWAIASAFGYPASPDKVTRFLEELQSSRRKKFISDRKETFDEYALPAGWIHVEVEGPGGRMLAAFDLGKSAGWPDSFVRIEEDGKPAIVRAYNLSSSDVRLGVQAWTEAGLWPGLTLPDVAQIDVHQRAEKQILSFVREERPVEPEEGAEPEAAPRTERVWKMVAPKRADPEAPRVEGLVRAFTGMRFAEIVGFGADEAESPRFGLVEPSYRIVLHGAKPEGAAEAPKYVLLVGSEVPPKGEGESSDRFFVRRETDGWVFEVGAMSIADFRQAPEDYLPLPEAPVVPETPAPTSDAHGSPDEEDAPDVPIPPGDDPPMPPPEDPD